MTTPPALSIWPLKGLPMFQAGDDLAEAFARSLEEGGLEPRDGDVLVIAQKIVSKAEGRQVALADVTPSAEAVALASQTLKEPEVCELILRESAQLMRVREGVVIVRHRLGHVLANAGIDASNVADPSGPVRVLLWPEDPDASARRIREALAERLGVNLAVVISDSLGRAWRVGTLGTAIGSAGLTPIRDRRGETDLFGRELIATITGVADELAAAGTLVMGEASEGLPAALIRGAVFPPGEGGVREILRAPEIDLFP
ncbi:MAG: coenzyme F420-0:L-glutamate ligase [Phenylobacterium sp.]